MNNHLKNTYNAYYEFAKDRTPFKGGFEDAISSWRRKFFIQVIMLLAPLSVIAYIPSHLTAMRDGYYYIMIFDTLAVVGIQILLFVKVIPLQWKKITLIMLFFLLGMVLLMGLGFGGPGFLYLVAVSVIAALAYHTAAGYITMALNAVFIFIIYYLDIPDILNIDAEPSASLGALLTYVINYLVLNTILVMAISSLIQTLSKKLNEEKILSSQLKKKNEEYAVAVTRAEASDRLKSQFLANMSHEIRTPLNAIIGFSDIVATEKDIPNQKGHSQTIKTSALRLLQVITDIVDASKISTGQIKIVKTDFDLKKTLEEINPILQDIIEESKKELFLILKHPDNVPTTINADREKLERVLLHLTENAIKNTEFGMIKIDYDYIESKGILVFRVKDTGKGISNKEINLIFNPFYQKEGEFNDGNGLGLTICKGFTELWGGEISVVSSPGTGSTFTFTLPV